MYIYDFLIQVQRAHEIDENNVLTTKDRDGDTDKETTRQKDRTTE